NDVELTAENFLTGIAGIPGRVYRTGDRVRRLSDGRIAFLGRLDQQVKIRGYRVEPGEIQQRLQIHEAVKEAVVAAKTDHRGSDYLCAYIVPAAASGELPETRLRDYLAKGIPQYMIPAFFIKMEKIPLTTTGKIDIKALHEPQNLENRNTEAPGTEMEMLLAEIWKELLGLETVGIEDNFFSHGGDSIKAIQMASRLQKHKYKIQLRDLFLKQTIRELAKHVVPLERNIPQDTVEGPLPLTPIQEWFFHSTFTGTFHYNHAVTLYSRDRFREPLIKKVFTGLITHHDALRMVFPFEDGDNRQRNPGLEGEMFHLETLEIEERDKGDQEERIERESGRIQAGIDLQKGPMVKLGLFNTNHGSYLLIVIHHLVVDGISWRILLEDIATAYRQAANGEEIKLQDKTDSFKNWAMQLKQYAESDAAIKEMEYWKKIDTANLEPLPEDQAVAAEDKIFKNTVTIQKQLSETETRRMLEEVHWEYNTEINDILLTALARAVDSWAGIRRIAINLEGHGREPIIEDIDISRTVGWFTAQYPVLLEIDNPGAGEPGSAGRREPVTGSDPRLPRQILAVKETLRRLPNKGIGYGILRYLTPPAKKDHYSFNLEPQIEFNYLGQFEMQKSAATRTGAHPSIEISGISTGAAISPYNQNPATLEINGIINDGRLTLNFSYNKKQYRPATIERLAQHYMTHLQTVIRHCTGKKALTFKPGLEPLEYQMQKEYDAYLERIRGEEQPDLSGKKRYQRILVTGGTGFLGVYIVQQLIEETEATLYLLVRGATPGAARDRMKKKSAFYLGEAFWETHKERLEVVHGNLRADDLGITPDRYRYFAGKLDAIIHSAANVKHVGLYEESYQDNVAATVRLMDLAHTGSPADFHYISTMNVGDVNMPGKETVVFTEYSHELGQETGNVYTKSKLEAEKEVLAYRKKGLNISICRMGNLVSHTQTGVFQENIEENSFFSNLRKTIAVGVVPRFEDDDEGEVDISFIDYSARAVVLLATRANLKNETYNLHSPYTLTWKGFMEFMSGVGIKVEWIEPERLEYYLSINRENKEKREVIEEWIKDRHKLRGSAAQPVTGETQVKLVSDRTRRILKELGFQWPDITEEHIGKMIAHCREVGFITQQPYD
ncbi:MAG: NAD-dependent epimerase/dehydratase family protein, partial [bacterium]|nr:NAD-dependent epimerase/dehydratase family protein [bacterium]